jgi:hypothetical protein
VTHPSDDDLVLHYYRDPDCRPGVEAHLDACGACAARYSDLRSTLALLPADGIPARDDRYGLEVWQRIRPELTSEAVPRGHAHALAIAASVLLVAAATFMAARQWTSVDPPAETVARTDVSAPPVDESRRVLFMAVADHLERSERVLTEVMNAGSEGALETQKAWAEDLLSSGRLYRQSALESDEPSVAAVLDDVERTLLDIVHAPARPSEAELDDVRSRVESAALLFKVRVLRDELHQQQRGAVNTGEPFVTLSKAS